MNPGRLICLGTLVCALAPSRANALDGPSSLVWNAPSGCPNQNELNAMIRGLAQAGLPQYEDVSVHAQVDQTSEEWLALITIATADGEGVRRLSASDCHKLADATALYVAVALDGLAAAQEEAAGPWEAPQAEADAPTTPTATPDTKQDQEADPPREADSEFTPEDAQASDPPATRLKKTTRSKRQLDKRFEFGLDAVLHSGITTALHPGLVARWSLQLARFRVQVAAHWLPQLLIYADSDQRDGPAILTWALGPSLEGCWIGRLGPRRSRALRPPKVRWSMPVCAATAVLVVVGHGRQVPIQNRVQANWVGVGATSGVEMERQFFSVRAGVGVYAALSRPNFEVADLPTVQSFPISAQFTLGIGFGR